MGFYFLKMKPRTAKNIEFMLRKYKISCFYYYNSPFILVLKKIRFFRQLQSDSS